MMPTATGTSPPPRAPSQDESLLAVEGLRVETRHRHRPVALVSDATFEVRSGRTLGLVGESGSGKSLTALAIMGLLPIGVHVTSGSARFAGEELTSLSEASYRRIRGSEIGLIMQDPQNSLNPAFSIGHQLIESLRAHSTLGKREAATRAVELLDRVGIPSPRERLRAYPHEFSGGMAQRVMIALAMSCEPSLLIADEPTTALDVTVQSQILELLLSVQADTGMSLLLISHDLSVVAQMTDEVAVMYAGEVVERADRRTIFDRPQHPYTDALLAAQPDSAAPGDSLVTIPGTVQPAGSQVSGCRFHPRCQHAADSCGEVHPSLLPTTTGSAVRCLRSDELTLAGRRGVAVLRDRTVEPIDHPGLLVVDGLTKDFAMRGRNRGDLRAVDDVSLEIQPGETLGLVGESGAGKSTVGRLVLGLEHPSAGTIEFDGTDVNEAVGAERKALREQISVVFQNPYASLDPTMQVADIVAEPFSILGRTGRVARRRQATELLAEVGLTEEFLDRRPRALSGGQRQRVAIARALALRPRLVVCDEVVSALDVSTQAQVLNLLSQLRETHDMALLFIGHALPVVRHVSHRLAVMYSGRVVEIGPADDVYRRARHPYTQELLGAALSLDPGAHQLEARLRSAAMAPEHGRGCVFAHRCPHVIDRCREERPLPRVLGESEVACHLAT